MVIVGLLAAFFLLRGLKEDIAFKYAKKCRPCGVRTEPFSAKFTGGSRVQYSTN